MRHMLITRRVETRFGAHYAHVAFDERGPVDVSISTPGKHSDTAVEAAMQTLCREITACLTEWRDGCE